MFKITNGKGVNIKFDNGYAISIQWGPFNYCENYVSSTGATEVEAGERGSVTAEIAIFDPDGEFYQPEGEDWGDDVHGYCNVAYVLKIMNHVASLQ
jgi:hypothetical protein